jgi:hypothetical protein
MAVTNEMFKVDSFTIDGEELAIVDGTATVSGTAGYENEAVLAATGTDATMRKRVERNIKTNLLFTEAVTPDKYTNIQNAQIVLSNLQTGQRVRFGNCRFKSLGEIGTNTVELNLVALTAPQWLSA